MVPLFPGKKINPKITQKLNGVSKFDSNTFSGGTKTGFDALSEYELRQQYPFLYNTSGKKDNY